MIANKRQDSPAGTRRVAVAVAVALAACLAPGSSRADVVAVNFDTTPALALGPSTFPAATASVAVANVGTFSGGAVVGNPTGLTSFGPGGGARNAYGTASFASTAYSPNLTFTAAAGVTISNIAGTLFNGYTDLVSYTVTAFNGTTQLSTVSFNDVGDVSDPTGYRNFSLSGTPALGITRLVVTPDTTFSGGAFDYFLDNVTITYTATAAVPEPASAGLLLLAAPALLAARRRKHAARAA